MKHVPSALRRPPPPYMKTTGAALGALAVAALINSHLARKAERQNAPQGRLMTVDGVRLHYIESGSESRWCYSTATEP